MHDYIVIGGGSAGCALTGRLIEAGASVLLIEAGPRDTHPLIHIPAGFTRLLSSPLLSRHETQAQTAMDGRKRILPQGRVLGGGSSVNALIYIRGQHEDYDDWAATGCNGWSFREVLPYFKRAEDNERFDNGFHATGGPLGVSDLKQVCELSRGFVRAAQQAGIPFTADFNGERQNGVGFNQITARNNRRCSAAVAYLRTAEKSERLTVITDATVQRVVLEGNQAVGVEYRHKGQVVQARCSKEVVLSAGAIQSPKLLMLSGIGPAAELERHGIAVQHTLPGVGQNLQDHAEVGSIAYCHGKYGYYGQDNAFNTVKNGLQYLMFGSGPVSSNVTEACAFINTDNPQERPNAQMHFVPIVFFDLDQEAIKKPGATINTCVLRPMSRGEIRLADKHADTPPLIDPRYFAHPEDRRVAIKGLNLSREILAQPAMRAYTDEEVFPGLSVRSDEALLSYINQRAKTVYHPVGTCKMGTDAMAVVDPELRVHGLRNLRVVDASIMPNLISGNTNAPSIMIGEKAADLILGRSALPAAHV
ncbi:GMC family oxidoreductase N-terminal domain-containing protein [Pseudomonas sp. 13B_2.1_Bac1]|uniref:GMC family oxidoreductase n=1 Tax=Pseudomonas sp. 13B_2.1_Bac1 TaxID=2971624 RepID=UPI0021CAD2FE|nr:GMC family oxidoreductase N-terminal domain-containing protein [Pseudomonas sp. 13B_2.1_Bac1]MCU1785368.1 GMC family oxidoreductase N-terminal domain-containing protein [Pseudomonas sp. 13B_2.1_Bac1]